MQFYNAAIFLTGLCLFYHTTCLSQLRETSENLKITVEFETPDFQLFTDNTYTPVTTFRGNTYFIWIDKNFRPKIGKIENGKISTAFLDPDPKYRVLNNMHHRFSIGVDQEGYLHIAGDMHHYPKSATDHLPDKYKDGIIMYWVSNRPEDISRFTWLGKNRDRALPGYGFTYLSFHHDMDGELYARCRNRIYKGSHNPGEMGYSIYRYNTGSKRWKNLGGKAPSNPTANWNSVIWEDDAHKKENVPDFYQGFLGQVRFDFNNRLHIAGAINNNTVFDAASHVVYAYSDDLGDSFYRADGSKIASLPIRVETGKSQGDIVDGPDKFATFASASFDIDGNPVVTYTRMNENVQFGMDPAYYRYFHNGVWSIRHSYPTGGHVKNIPVVDANGIINFLNNNGRIMRTQKLGKPGYFVDIGGNFVSVDERGIREQNILRGMMLKNGKLQVVSIEFTPKLKNPLATSWSTTNLGTASGSSSSYNNVHQLISSGDGFKGNDVNGRFCYQKIIGDGAIEARIINVNYTGDDAFAGLMIAESLDNGAFYANIITHGGLRTHYRTDGQIETGKKIGNKQPSEWLRIVREGNKISAFGSNNGESWYLVEERTIVMNQEMYIGVITGSGNNALGHARVDHIDIKTNVVSGNEIPQEEADCSKLKVEAEVENETCNGNDGKIKLSVSGGSAPYEYSWSHGPSSNNLTNLAVGNYRVTITDQSGCSIEKKLTVNTQPGPVKPVIIQNEHYLRVKEPSADMALSWYHNGTRMVGITGDQISITKSGSYSVIVTDNNGCFTASDVMTFEGKTEEESLETSGSMIQDFRMYPVPASTTLNIDIQTSIPAEISYEISSMAGNLLLSSNAGNNSGNKSLIIDVSSLPPGVHLLKLQLLNEIIVRRFLKQ